MKTIYKYTLGHVDRQTIEMPLEANIIHVREQNGNVCMWAEVDPKRLEGNRTFCIVGTGHTIPVGCDYVGTCHIDEFVWHIYEVVR